MTQVDSRDGDLYQVSILMNPLTRLNFDHFIPMTALQLSKCDGGCTYIDKTNNCYETIEDVLIEGDRVTFKIYSGGSQSFHKDEILLTTSNYAARSCDYIISPLTKWKMMPIEDVRVGDVVVVERHNAGRNVPIKVRYISHDPEGSCCGAEPYEEDRTFAVSITCEFNGSNGGSWFGYEKGSLVRAVTHD